jgi:hypothetical protein
MKIPDGFRSGICAALAAAAFAVVGARGDDLSGPALVKSLKSGGLVILMRHASAPAAAPDPAQAELDNTGHERQLDAAGKQASRQMGAAFRKLGIPVGAVYVSPTYRARETVRLAGLPAPVIRQELGDGGTSMSAKSVAGWADWLRTEAVTRPAPGTDTVIVTQNPNIASAFPADARGLADGGALVLRPDGSEAHVVAKIPMTAWPILATGK